MKSAFPVLLFFSLLVGGCASSWSRSYDRWDRLSRDVPDGKFWKWTSCIDEKSRRSEVAATPEQEAEWEKVRNDPEKWGNNASGFASVLGACSHLMVGPNWRFLSAKQIRQMIDDAWQHYNVIQAEENARDLEAII